MIFKTAKCKECGKDIIWATNPATGKHVPLDAKAVVYKIEAREVEGKEVYLALQNPDFKVTHWATCPKANEVKERQKVKTQND